MTTHTLPPPDRPVSQLTIADLEALIAEIVRRVLREEIQRATELPHNGHSLSEALLATFGTWEDSRPVETIISEIYESRTVSTGEVSL
jgi:hypothetical protein